MSSIQDSDLMDYNKGKQDYILARLIILRKYIRNNQLLDALECVDDIYNDIDTDYNSDLNQNRYD